MHNDLNIAVIKKGEEHFLFLYPDSRLKDALRSVGKMASDQDLNFIWEDAAIVSKSMRLQKTCGALPKNNRF